jgi:hypothetical protein
VHSSQRTAIRDRYRSVNTEEDDREMQKAMEVSAEFKLTCLRVHRCCAMYRCANFASKAGTLTSTGEQATGSCVSCLPLQAINEMNARTPPPPALSRERCHTDEHSELDGRVVKWGADHFVVRFRGPLMWVGSERRKWVGDRTVQASCRRGKLCDVLPGAGDGGRLLRRVRQAQRLQRVGVVRQP